MDKREHRVVRFDAFTIDIDAAEIRRDGDVVNVEPQVFDLIVLLCSNPGRVVGHDEIIEKVWHGRVVSDSAIATRINAARKALGDDGTVQRAIKTVRGRGFRFELMPIETGSAAIEKSAADGVDETFILSCTPHGYSLLMETRGGETQQDWRESLPMLLAETAARHGGAISSAHLAVFHSAVDAVSCAGDLIEAVHKHCAALLRRALGGT